MERAAWDCGPQSIEEKHMEETRKPARKPRAASDAKPAAKPAAKAAAKQQAPSRKPVVRKAPAKAGPPPAAPPDREERVRLAAYFRAQRRGFTPGHEWEDWLAAERELTASTAPASAPQPRKTRKG